MGHFSCGLFLALCRDHHKRAGKIACPGVRSFSLNFSFGELSGPPQRWNALPKRAPVPECHPHPRYHPEDARRLTLETKILSLNISCSQNTIHRDLSFYRSVQCQPSELVTMEAGGKQGLMCFEPANGKGTRLKKTALHRATRLIMTNTECSTKTIIEAAIYCD